MATRDAVDSPSLPLAVPDWVKASLRVLRRPQLLAAVFVATLTLGVAAAASGPFLSSAADAALAGGIRRSSAAYAGLTVVSWGPVRDDVLAFKDGRLGQTTSRVRGLGPPSLTIVGSQVTLTTPGNPTAVRVQLAAKTGFLTHVHELSPAARGSVWVSETTARTLGVRPGARIELHELGASAHARVAGVFGDLASQASSSFWAPLSELIYPPALPHTPIPPPLLLADPQTMARLGRQLQDSGTYTWNFPLSRDQMTMSRAERISAELQSLEADLADPTARVGEAFANSTSSSGLPSIVAAARQTVTSVAGPVGTMTLAAELLALAVVGAVGVFWARRRRTEILLLSAKGARPWRIGALAFVEHAAPAALGCGLGAALAIGLVRLLGPSGFVETDTISAAVEHAGEALGAGLLLLAFAAGIAARAATIEPSGFPRGQLARSPWEAVVLALAAASYYEIHTRGTGPAGGHMDGLLLAFPVLLIAGTAGLAGRGLGRLLRGAAGLGDAWPATLFLAIRSVLASLRVTVLLLTASACALGVLAYAGILVASASATARQKAEVFVGSDVAAIVAVPVPVTGPTTTVFRAQGVIVPSQTQVNVLGINPSTFARGAYWDPGFASDPLSALLAELGRARGPQVAVLAAGRVPLHPTISLSGLAVPIRIVATVRAFPGMQAGAPLLVTDTSQLERVLKAAGGSLAGAGASVEVWGRGSPAEFTRLLGRAGATPGPVVTATDVMRTPGFLSLSWTFGYLQALGAMAGLAVLATVLLYAQARQRGRVVAYALARRMGLGRGRHLAALEFELGGMLLVAFVVGVSLAWIADVLVYRRLDPLPGIAPGPVLRMPWTELGAILLGLMLVAWIGAALVQWTAERASVAEVMRLASG